MSNNKLITKRGKYTTDEEGMNAIRRSKAKYLLNEEWCCDICDSNHNYTLGGKWMHLKTKKHQKNAENE